MGGVKKGHIKAPAAKKLTKKAAAKPMKAAAKKKAASAGQAPPKTPQKGKGAPPGALASLALGAASPAPSSIKQRSDLEQAYRALTKKFPHVQRQHMEAIMNKEGVRLADVVSAEIVRTTKASTYIKATFWTQIEDEFDLGGSSIFDSLPEPEKEESVDPELARVLLKTIDENPAMRSTDDAQIYFEYCGQLNQTELYGALMSCRPQANLSMKHKHELETILLTYLGAHSGKERYPLLWEHCHEFFEMVFLRMWLAASGAGRKQFVVQNRNLIDCFLDSESVTNVETAHDENRDPDLPSIRKCLESPVGASLYEKQGKQIQWIRFLEAIRVGLQTLFHQDYTEEEFNAFEGRMRTEVNVLQRSGISVMQEKLQAPRFFVCRSALAYLEVFPR